jgi:hypothetical protein
MEWVGVTKTVQFFLEGSCWPENITWNTTGGADFSEVHSAAETDLGDRSWLRSRYQQCVCKNSLFRFQFITSNDLVYITNGSSEWILIQVFGILPTSMGRSSYFIKAELSLCLTTRSRSHTWEWGYSSQYSNPQQRWRWVAIVTCRPFCSCGESSRCSLYRKLGGSQSWSQRRGETNCCPCREWNSDSFRQVPSSHTARSSILHHLGLVCTCRRYYLRQRKAHADSCQPLTKEIRAQYAWELWRIKWKYDRYFSQQLPYQLSFHLCSMLSTFQAATTGQFQTAPTDSSLTTRYY